MRNAECIVHSALCIVHCLYLYGSMRASLAASTSATVVVPRSPRFRFVDLLLRMCCLNAFPRRNLPFFVRLKRFAAPRCVLILSFFAFLAICPRCFTAEIAETAERLLL